MRKSRFTEAQIIGMIKEHGSSVKRLIQWINRSAERNADGGNVPKAWAEHSDLLQVKGQVWRDGCALTHKPAVMQEAEGRPRKAA